MTERTAGIGLGVGAGVGRRPPAQRKVPGWWPVLPATPYVSPLHSDVLVPYLTNRDRAILRTVARHKLLRTSQIRRLFFLDTSPQVPHRVLKRLSDNRVLERVDRQRMFGELLGSGEFIYRVGPAGRKLLDGLPVKKTRPKAPQHALEMTELYVELVEFWRAGMISDLDFAPESYAWRNYQDFKIEPDAYVEIVTGGRRGRFFIELDISRSDDARIQNKMTRYQLARRETPATERFPQVLWIIHDPENPGARLQRVQRLIAGQTDQDLFSTVLYEDRFRTLLGA